MRDWWKLSVLEDSLDGRGGVFVVKMVAIPTRRDAVIIADSLAAKGHIVRVSKHINPKKEYYYGK